MESWKEELYQNELFHHGIKGQKWGKRRWQYEDKSLTPEGRIRYRNGRVAGSRSDVEGNDTLSDDRRYQKRTASKGGNAYTNASGKASKKNNGDYETSIGYRNGVVKQWSSNNNSSYNKSLNVAQMNPDNLAVRRTAKRADSKDSLTNWGQTHGYHAGFNDNVYESAPTAKYRALNNAYNNQNSFEYQMKQRVNELVSNVSSAASSAKSYVEDVASTAIDYASDAYNSAVSAGQDLLDKIFGK